MNIEQKKQVSSRVAPIARPHQKIRLKRIENRRDLPQTTRESLTGFRVSPEIDTILEDLMPPPRRRNDQGYFPAIDTFEFPAITSLSMPPIRVVEDGHVRWRILVGLVAILVISLIGIGIFSAYLLGPALASYLHRLVG